MTQTFDTYGKRSIAYKVIIGLYILLAVHVLALLIFNKRLQSDLSFFWQGFLIATFLLSFWGTSVGNSIRVNSLRIAMYIKDGDLTINSHEIILNSNTYQLGDLNRIEYKVSGYKGQVIGKATRDGTGNRIRLYKKTNRVIEKSFVIHTETQHDALKEILTQWKQSGFKVRVDSFDLK